MQYLRRTTSYTPPTKKAACEKPNVVCCCFIRKIKRTSMSVLSLRHTRQTAYFKVMCVYTYILSLPLSLSPSLFIHMASIPSAKIITTAVATISKQLPKYKNISRKISLMHNASHILFFSCAYRRARCVMQHALAVCTTAAVYITNHYPVHLSADGCVCCERVAVRMRLRQF